MIWRNWGAEDPQAWRLIGDASRLAFADRGRYMADSDYVPMPTEGLVAADYLEARANLLEGEAALEEVSPGSPEFDHALWADDEALELPSTSHISIVDSYGNVLSMTTTIENAFGSRLMTGGFLLNNEAHRFLLPQPPRRGADCQPAGAGQAAAFLDGADYRDEGRRAGAGDRLRPEAAGSSAMWQSRSSPGPTGAWTCSRRWPCRMR